MNGLHLKALPSEKLTKLVGEQWKSAGILTESEGSFVDVCMAAFSSDPNIKKLI